MQQTPRHNSQKIKTMSVYCYLYCDTIFLYSYTISYLISIIWQHAINRIMLSQYSNDNIGYCSSLLHTYTVYSASLALVSLFGSLAIRYLYAPATLIALISIPFAGVINYYSLHNMAMNQCIESVIEQYNSDNRTTTTNNVYVYQPSTNSSVVTFTLQIVRPPTLYHSRDNSIPT